MTEEACHQLANTPAQLSERKALHRHFCNSQLSLTIMKLFLCYVYKSMEA